MHRYFFHVEDGTSYRDYCGAEFRSLEDLRKAAIEAAGSQIKECALPLGENWRMVVEDEFGLVVLRVDLLVSSIQADQR